MRINNQVLGNELTIKNPPAQAVELNTTSISLKSAVQLQSFDMAVKEGLENIMSLIVHREGLLSQLPEELRKIASAMMTEAFHQKQIFQSGLPSILSASNKVNENLASLLAALEANLGMQQKANPDSQNQTNIGTLQPMPDAQPQANSGTQQPSPDAQPSFNPGVQQTVASMQPQTGTGTQQTNPNIIQTNPNTPPNSPATLLQDTTDTLLQPRAGLQPQANPGLQRQILPDTLPQIVPAVLTEALRQLWRKAPTSEQERIIKTLKNLIDTYKEVHHNKSNSFSVPIPLYFAESSRAYPAFVHIYYDQENNRSSDEIQYSREFWLRICLLTENLGPVDIVFRLYNKNKLDIRLNTITNEIGGVFNTADLKALLTNIPMQINNVVIKSL